MTTITLVLNDAEQQALHQLLDTALRQAGLNALDVVSHFVGRISAAQGAAAQSQKVVNAGTTQPQPAPALVQTSGAASTGQTNAGQTAQAHAGAASTTAPVAHVATPASANAPTTQHQSVLSHLIGEITGSNHAQASTHPAAAPAPAPAAVRHAQSAAAAAVAPAATVTPAVAPATPVTGQPAQSAASGASPAAS